MDLEVPRSTVEENAYLTTREMAIMLGYNQSTIVCGLEKLGKVAKLFTKIWEKNIRIDLIITS